MSKFTLLGGTLSTIIILSNLLILEQNLTNLIYSLIIWIVLGTMIKGSEHSLFYILSGGIVNKPVITIHGNVEPGYESIKKMFAYNFETGMEQGSQFVAYVKGKKVVDIWGNYNNQNEYKQDTLQNLFSTSKNITAIVMAMLVDRNLIDYDEKITKYWPEFGQQGKENIKIVDVLKHESGLHQLDSIGQPDISRENIKNNIIGKKIEDEPQKFPKNTIRSYHASSRGYIMNEIVRRVDPQQRTIGEFVEQEIRKPLNIDLWIGLPEEKISQCAYLTESIQKRFSWGFIQGFVPKFINGRVQLNSLILLIIHLMVNKMYKSPTALKWNTDENKKGEAPSVNAISNAKSLALLGSIMANKGKYNDFQLFSEKTYDIAMSDPTIRLDAFMRKTTKITKGGFFIYDKEQQIQISYDTEGFIGFQGMGGSTLHWHNEQQIACSYTMNLLDLDFKSTKGYKLKAELFKAVQKLNKNK